MKRWTLAVSVSHDIRPCLIFQTRHVHRGWIIPRGFRWFAHLMARWCKWRHREYHVMGMPTCGRKLWYPVFCTECGTRYEIEKDYASDFPSMGCAYVRLAEFERHHARVKAE